MLRVSPEDPARSRPAAPAGPAGAPGAEPVEPRAKSTEPGALTDAGDARLPRLQAALADCARAYRMLMENVEDAVIATDADGLILDGNARACEMLGYERRELRGLAFAGTCAPEERGVAAERLRRLVPGVPVLTEHALLRKDGTTVQVEARAQRLPDGRVQVVLRDLTGPRESQRGGGLGHLTASIAHDLNNRLTVMLSNAALIAQAVPASADVSQEVADFRAAARDAAALVRRLTTLSRDGAQGHGGSDGESPSGADAPQERLRPERTT